MNSKMFPLLFLILMVVVQSQTVQELRTMSNATLFGSYTILSSDGMILIAVGRETNIGEIYEKKMDGWQYKGNLENDTPIRSVSISEDKEKIVLGGDSGVVTVYGRNGTNWMIEDKLETNVTRGPIHVRHNTIVVGNPSVYGLGETLIYTKKSDWSLDSRLVGSGYMGFMVHQGSSVALSADGKTLAIGADFDNYGMGATWIFTRADNSSSWVEETKIEGSDGQGKMVDISADGNVLAVSGNKHVFIYVRSNLWQLRSEIKVMGVSMSISADGNFLAIGGRRNGMVWVYKQSGELYFTKQFGGRKAVVSIAGDALAVGSPKKGSVSIYTNYTVRQEYMYDDSVNQTKSVSLYADTLAVGMYEESGYVGSTVIYNRQTDGEWIRGETLLGTDTKGLSAQGISVSLDDHVLAIGGFMDHSGIGATWVFTSTNNIHWVQQAKIVATNTIGAANQGIAVSLKGEYLAIGGNADNNYMGATWIYKRNGANWIQQQKLVGSKSIGLAGQGISLSLSGDGTTVAIGGYYDNTAIGATWIFRRVHDTWYEEVKLIGSRYIGEVIYQGASVSVSYDGMIVAVGAPGDNNDKGATWIFSRGKRGTWQEEAKLTNQELSKQGQSVNLSPDGRVVAIGSGNATVVYGRKGQKWKQIGATIEGQSASVSLYNNDLLATDSLVISNLTKPFVV